MDLSSLGHQPMCWEQLVIVYNGEVYNFGEIRRELEALAYGFTSTSDTEVILKAFHAWGIGMVERLNGMFAIAIYDRVARKLTLLRDRAGVKPLYWYFSDGILMFGSELKSLYKHPRFNKDLDWDSLGIFLQMGHIPQPRTIFKDTHKLPSGSYLELDLESADYRIQRYWSVTDPYAKEKVDLSETEVLDHLEGLLASACNYRMVSDVPVGIFLSGGYDSSLVAAMVQKDLPSKVKTFTIGFEEAKFDEAPYARKVAEHLGTEHMEYRCTERDALELLESLVHFWDEPFADSSAIPTLLVSRMARQSVAVTLSADGGDELFGGYEKYESALKYFRLNSLFPVGKLAGTLLGALREPLLGTRLMDESRLYIMDNILKNAQSRDALDYLHHYQKFYLDNELIRLSTKLFPTHLLGDSMGRFASIQNPMDRMMAWDYQSYQQDVILTKVDRATMAFGLEGREPLLDYRLVEYVGRLPVDLKLKNGVKKYLLKEIVHRYIPKGLMDRPKMGFSIPLVRWLLEDLKEQTSYYFGAEFVRRQGIFDSEAVAQLLETFRRRKDINFANKVWNLLIFQMWYAKWMED